MRLSDAIRLGSMLRPQAFGEFFNGGGSCALGAASEAAGLRLTTSGPYADLADVFPILNSQSDCVCHVCQSHCIELGFVVTHLNDDHRWTRQQIADWVATVEPQPVAQPHAEVAVKPAALAG